VADKPFTLIHADCIAAMRAMPENSVDAIVTDPPYELGFMGKSWDKSGIANSVEMWAEALRVLKPGGHLLAFSGSRTYHRMTCAIEDAGFEVRDQMMWVYGSGFPKSLNVGKKTEGWDGWGTALKPAHEPICVARKPLDGTVAENIRKWGVGGLNIDGCRVNAPEGVSTFTRPKVSDENRTSFNMGTSKANGVTGQGRWPANLMHDGSDEVVGLFPETGASSKRIGKRNGKEIGTFGKFNGQDEVEMGHNDNGGSAARFFYCPKASKSDRDDGLDGFDASRRSAMGYERGLGDAGEGMFKDRNPIKRNIHPTVKPTELMRYLCRLITPPGGTVLDPFNGSGSTGRGAVLEGFCYIGIDQSDEYLRISEARINAALNKQTK
jgi:site-specific DNA-methyltransferase (adenine-specific)